VPSITTLTPVDEAHPAPLLGAAPPPRQLSDLCEHRRRIAHIELARGRARGGGPQRRETAWRDPLDAWGRRSPTIRVPGATRHLGKFRIGPGTRIAIHAVVGLRSMRLVSQKGSPSAKTLMSSTSGVVFVEYVALLLLVTVIGAVAVVGLGVPLLKLYRFAQMILSLPVP
jgi:hypothetical protein